MDWGSVFCPSPNFCNSVTSKPEDAWLGVITRPIVMYVTRCVSLAVVFDLLSFYFSSLAD